ncbi:MAG: tetratricopeptide repeat protein [Treponema sp.]|jgi:TolA-binding protein|nr:tetratricopeptide repeat protein [Treponema sp.]
MKKRILWLLCAIMIGGTAFPQASTNLETGIKLYADGKWKEAISVLRQVLTINAALDQRVEAVYWTALAEIADSDYMGAINDLNALDQMEWNSPRKLEIPYHKGRCFYYLERFDEALVLLKNYADSIPDNTEEGIRQKSAALYWTGECLYSLGHLDRAHDIFLTITQKYPQSAKYEAAFYRMAIINQKKIEIELLGILKRTHEESLKIIEEYQYRERTYDQALTAYQRRIATLEASLRKLNPDKPIDAETE